MILSHYCKGALLSMATFILFSCNNTPSQADSSQGAVAAKQIPGGGLANADNRKVIIAQLGKQYKKSVGGKWKKKIDSIAPFKIQLVNGQKFTYKDLTWDKPVTLVYFSADCQECQNFTKAVTERIDRFKNRQLLFISYEDIEAVKAFYKKLELKRFPQIIVGTEGYSFIVQQYYKIEHFPFVVNYDQSGHLLNIFTNKTSPQKLAEII